MAEKKNQPSPVHRVKLVKNVMIPMRDGVHLAADLIMPEEKGRYPGIVQYHPYRKDDMSLGGNDSHYYFARRGYVGVRLDVRGTGSSEGYTKDEYSVQEIEDGQDAIKWLADQEWCTGELGMFGYSYSGTTTMVQASYAPKPLKAVVPVYFADDRYRADSHYISGSPIPMVDCGMYAPFMTCYNAAPPYPEYSGERWLELWRERLEKSTPWPINWLEHPLDDEYWVPGSVRHRYDRVKAATFIVAGWRDAYPGAEIRVYEQISSPKKLLIGPWMHTRPDVGMPGPRIDINGTMLRWWDYWLKGVQNGVMDEPPVTLYVQTYDPPGSARRDTTSGSWRYEEEWPIERTVEKTLFLAYGWALSDRADSNEEAQDTYTYAPHVGVHGGYQSQGNPYILPMDQRFEEGFSLNYTTAPLDSETEVTGFPKAILSVSSTASVASFVVRLSDVAPDGVAAPVSKGVMNATRRDSLLKPEPLVPGEVYELAIPLEATSWVFQKGHRIRISISSSDWPNMWPTPYQSINTVHRGSSRPSRVLLPVVPRSAEKNEVPEFLPPAPLPAAAEVIPGAEGYREIHDYFTNQVLIEAKRAENLTVFLRDIGAQVTTRQEFEAGVSTAIPSNSHVKGIFRMNIKRRDVTIDVVGTNALSSTRDDMHFIAQVDIRIDGVPFFSKNWTKVFERKLA